MLDHLLDFGFRSASLPQLKDDEIFLVILKHADRLHNPCLVSIILFPGTQPIGTTIKRRINQSHHFMLKQRHGSVGSTNCKFVRLMCLRGSGVWLPSGFPTGRIWKWSEGLLRKRPAVRPELAVCPRNKHLYVSLLSEHWQSSLRHHCCTYHCKFEHGTICYCIKCFQRWVLDMVFNKYHSSCVEIVSTHNAISFSISSS